MKDKELATPDRGIPIRVSFSKLSGSELLPLALALDSAQVPHTWAWLLPLALALDSAQTQAGWFIISSEPWYTLISTVSHHPHEKHLCV